MTFQAVVTTGSCPHTWQLAAAAREQRRCRVLIQLTVIYFALISASPPGKFAVSSSAGRSQQEFFFSPPFPSPHTPRDAGISRAGFIGGFIGFYLNPRKFTPHQQRRSGRLGFKSCSFRVINPGEMRIFSFSISSRRGKTSPGGAGGGFFPWDK